MGRPLAALPLAAVTIAAVALVAFACPAGAQENPATTPGALTPEQVTDAVINHLAISVQRLDEPIGNDVPSVPFLGMEAFDGANRALKYWLWLWSCILAAEDMEGLLREYAKRYYKDDPKKLDAFNDKLKEYRSARGSARERAERSAKAQKKIDDLRNQVADIPGPKTIQHMLYHLASAKVIVSAHIADVPDLAKPLKMWKTVSCPGEDCRLETEAEKDERRR
jgi:hypothetical protein